jgi:hypothetical protein
LAREIIKMITRLTRDPWKVEEPKSFGLLVIWLSVRHRYSCPLAITIRINLDD